MINVSGFGLQGRLTASNTFPTGFSITEFADDQDPLESPDFTAADTAMGLNGDFLVWSRPAGIEISVNVIPFSQADVNLDILLEANRVAKNKSSARDVVNIVFTYPGGTVASLQKGVMVIGTVAPPVQSSGRIKTKTYRFRFENITKTNMANQEL